MDGIVVVSYVNWFGGYFCELINVVIMFVVELEGWFMVYLEFDMFVD